MSRRAGFTLLEIMLAMFIGLLITSIAVPSISAMMREQRLKALFDQFNAFAHQAQTRAVNERRTIVMVWDKTGAALVPLEPREEDAALEPMRFEFQEGDQWTLERPAALVEKPVWEWPFWPSGACEPAKITYAGELGAWAVQYNPLTARATFNDSEVK